MEVNHVQTNGTTKSLENEESSSDSEESQESIKSKVPDQLLMEFLINMMKKDFVVAEKLCKMILLYDPEHEQALSFQPLLQEMIETVNDNAEADAEDNDDSESETEDSSESDSNETDSNSDTNSEKSESESKNQD